MSNNHYYSVATCFEQICQGLLKFHAEQRKIHQITLYLQINANHSSNSNADSIDILYLKKLEDLFEIAPTQRADIYIISNSFIKDSFHLYLYKKILKLERFRKGSDVVSIYMEQLFAESNLPFKALNYNHIMQYLTVKDWLILFDQAYQPSYHQNQQIRHSKLFKLNPKLGQKYIDKKQITNHPLYQWLSVLSNNHNLKDK